MDSVPEGCVRFGCGDGDYIEIRPECDATWSDGTRRPQVCVVSHEDDDNRNTVIWVDTWAVPVFIAALERMASDLDRMARELDREGKPVE